MQEYSILINLLIIIPFLSGLFLIFNHQNFLLSLIIKIIHFIFPVNFFYKFLRLKKNSKLKKNNEKNKKVKNYPELLVWIASFISFIISLLLFFDLKNGIESYNFIYNISREYNINYSLQINNLNIYLILLTNIISIIAIIESPIKNNINSNDSNDSNDNIVKNEIYLLNESHLDIKEENKSIVQNNIYYALVLILSAGINTFFLAKDIVLFYILYEFILIPTFIIIGVWGGKNKNYAAMKFFLYTFILSIISLVAIIFIISFLKNSDIDYISNNINIIPKEYTIWLWIAFLISFAVKIPMIPFHTWLPDAHVEAPTGGSIILAAILLKMGGYAMQKILIPFFPEISENFSNLIIGWSCFTMIYTSFIAFSQQDMKKMIAYSSISHMSYLTASIFAGTKYSQLAATIQMISHGLISAGIFLLIGIISEITHDRSISKYSGIARTNPKIAVFFIAFVMASIGFPGTSGFIAEFICLNAVFLNNTIYGLIMTSGMIFSAIYIINLIEKIIFGTSSIDSKAIKPLNFSRIITLSFLIFLIILIGLKPSSIFYEFPKK
ncbi:complex I subunit 4 family protein [Lyticum sinuosum]|uniref:NADH-quinone oxidoreductase subunit M n=1 Tax=Lyticum sinuosum TaxID=1332059 RepID=A0AAE4VMC0_9RICK|nr:NADH-quinone oxidoreductase subunit M [Lyticum sinuosum]MDZ5761319.1 NADH-quinone oxidoreductase subunit M [Lyticum sinuosum]